LPLAPRAPPPRGRRGADPLRAEQAAAGAAGGAAAPAALPGPGEPEDAAEWFGELLDEALLRVDLAVDAARAALHVRPLAQPGPGAGLWQELGRRGAGMLLWLPSSYRGADAALTRHASCIYRARTGHEATQLQGVFAGSREGHLGKGAEVHQHLHACQGLL